VYDIFNSIIFYDISILVESGQQPDDEKLTRVLSTKLSIDDYNICKVIAQKLFENR
jgi:hypothetical protein